MMVDTGAAVTIVTEKWATAHGLRITPGKKIQIRGAGGANVETLGTATFTVQVSPTLELDLSDVVVSVGDFYQALKGGDVLRGKSGILGPAQIVMLSSMTVGNIQWRQLRGGCMAVANFIHPSILANPANILPPAPPAAPMTKARTTLAKEGVEMAPAQMELLSKLAAERYS